MVGLVAGKEVRYTALLSLAFATRPGWWDQTALIERIRCSEFSLLALGYSIVAPLIEGARRPIDAGAVRDNPVRLRAGQA